MSQVQSTHSDDPSPEDALEKHDDPKMDRAAQADCWDAGALGRAGPIGR